MKANFVGLMLCIVMALSGCGTSDTNNSRGAVAEVTTNADANAFPVTVMGADGEVTIKKEPKRVVSVFYEDNVIALGGALVGSGTVANDDDGYFDYLADKMQGVQQIGTYPYNIEKIIALQPDLVIMAGKVFDEEQYKKLSTISPVIQIDFQTMTWEEVHLLIGKALGKEAAARAYIEEYKTKEAALKAELQKTMAGKEVAYITPDGKEKFSLWGRTDKGDVGPILYDRFGLTAAPGVPDTYESISLEGLVKIDPEVLLISKSYFPEDFKNMATWKNLRAVKNNQVYELDKDFRIKAYYPLGMMDNLNQVEQLLAP
ncbi:ABC transporter substrate-binding protein [Paenibacillus glycanilyticus]|uniref:Iron(3+)-hydroxamate-binding protein YxeB n=1 Tax=Paenibacillus glycanilyticus TaxID=126569 RepID=A0ABQ6G7P8_9BACL|nr:ABC transporter substrate-binding protein [Paenibacillus glycanilyticus]GLX66979.1 iron(3+)-hydroxamate-binding protein YxeB [Paenibacillus glycanilyticus]